MIEEQGVVVALEGCRAWVQTIRTSACQSCSAKSTCGQSALAKMSEGKANQVLVDNCLQAEVGDTVKLGVSEQALLSASFWVYFVPLVVMIIASMIVNHFWASEGVTIIAGVSGLIFGFWIARQIGRQSANRFEPVMLKKVHQPFISAQ